MRQHLTMNHKGQAWADLHHVYRQSLNVRVLCAGASGDCVPQP